MDDSPGTELGELTIQNSLGRPIAWMNTGESPSFPLMASTIAQKMSRGLKGNDVTAAYAEDACRWSNSRRTLSKETHHRALVTVT
jgi:hypothetical protein